MRDDVVQLTSDPGPLAGHGPLGLTIQRRVARGEQRGLPASPDEQAGQPQCQDLREENNARRLDDLIAAENGRAAWCFRLTGHEVKNRAYGHDAEAGEG